MSLRTLLLVPLTTLPLIISGTTSPLPRQEPAFSLRIESLSRYPRAVRVRTTGWGSERRRPEPQDTLVQPPATLSVPDSIRRIQIVVQGFGSVRVTLTNRLAPDSIISEGRDITLARQASGRFERIWTVQPLLP
jgi:hypothetical protein